MKKLSTQDFIERSNIAHNNEYDYSESIYLGKSLPVNVKHKKCGMTFSQNAGNHMKGHGCRFCAKQYMNTEIFIKKSREIHGNDRYSYSLTIYKSAKEKLKIFCNICEKVFTQTASNHLQGYGCNHCGGTKRKTFDEFHEKAKSIHGNGFSYNSKDFKSLTEKMTIKCNSCDSIFKQTPKKHLDGNGCPNCRNESMGWRRSNFIQFCLKNNGMAKIYLIHCFGGDECFYKIGITCNDLKTRYPSKRSMPYNYKVLSEKVMDAGAVWDCEKEIIRLNKLLKYSPLIAFGGSATECFSSISSEVAKFFGVSL